MANSLIKWGDSTGTHGSDVISVNPKTGEVELWDSKVRTRTTKGTESPTFANENTREKAIEEAKLEIRSNTSLSEKTKDIALENLRKKNFTTYTVGQGKVKNSTIQKYCNNERCN